MAYTPKYVTIEDVEQLVQFQLWDDTKPTRAQVLDWIEKLEDEIDALRLGWKDSGSAGDGYLATDIYLDVISPYRSVTPLRAFELLAEAGIDINRARTGCLVPIPTNYRPIISVTKLEVRSGALTELPSWTELTEGWDEGWSEAAGTDFLIVKEKGRCDQEHGIAFWFYGSSMPTPGNARLKVTIKHGWNLPESILTRYCTLKITKRVLNTATRAGEPTAIAGWSGGDFGSFINNQLKADLEAYDLEVKEIEVKYFPRKLKTAVLWI